ncbi:unnamed protein product [Chilo suppressalis]|uniref:Ig-like domain-containing protein n=1 Tax=Chilo suppressalis TaxID=168631 RepID=A0ABN8B7N4_CHISP|nr:unnamed protein product [Chilo suppressalis]
MCSNDSNTLHVQVFDTVYFNLISNLYMNYFWCYNGKGQFTLKGDDYKNMTSALFQVTDTLAGQWNCSIYTKKDVKYIENRSVNYLGHNYLKFTCQMTLYVKHKLLLTIFSAKDKRFTQEHFKNGVYHYKEGDHFTFSCSCLSVKSSVLPKGTSLRIFQMREPPKITLAGGKGKFYETSVSNYIYEGTTNDTITSLICSRKQTDGSLQWVFCSNKTDDTCMTTVKNKQSQTITLDNFYLSPELNGTDVKCIYTSPVGDQSKSTISLNLTEENHHNKGSALIVIGYVSAVLGSVCIGALSLYFGCRRRCRGTTLNNTINRPLPEVPPRSVDETNNGIELGEHVYGTIDNAEGDYSYVIIDRRNPEDYGIPR